MKIIICKYCGIAQDKEILEKNFATKIRFFLGTIHRFFICQNCGVENEE